jgi:hypothetical protein
VLTLQILSNIQNYAELNSKSDDDFIPEHYGFDAHPPIPGKILHLQEIQEEPEQSSSKFELNLPNKNID